MLIKLIVVSFLLVGTISCVPQGRVVNGFDSRITKYPFMISLRSPRGGHSCGGSIIAPNWVLTAAHCVNVPYVLNQTTQFGLTDVAVDGPNVVPIKRIIMYSEYAPERMFKNDIALIELAGRLVYNYKTIAPVQLAEKDFEIDQVPEGVPGVLAGWGLNATHGVRQKTLQEVNLKIYSDEMCQKIKYQNTDSSQLCAGVDNGGKGACRSDSGGPLIYKSSIQVGVASYSDVECGITADVYTKVSHYIDWIYRHIR